MITSHNTINHFKFPIKKLLTTDLFKSPGQIFRVLQLTSLAKKSEKRRLKNQIINKAAIPYACIFSVTWKCNLNCIGCYAKKYPHDKMLNINEIENILQQSCELGIYVFVIVGGEPLFVPGLIETLVKFKNAFFLLFTNGTLLNEEHVSKLKKAKNILPVISIEGSKSQIDHRRGEGTGNMVSEAINLLSKKRVPFGISAMITRVNFNEVLSKDWLDELWKFGARFGFIIDYIPFPETLNKSLILDFKDIELKKKIINEINKTSKISLFNFPEDEYKKNGCQSAGNGFIHINANGFVEPCPFSHYAVDNIRDKPLLEILRSAFFENLRKEFFDKNDTGVCMLFYNEDKVKSVADKTRAFSTQH